jgi:hypothetical protein
LIPDQKFGMTGLTDMKAVLALAALIAVTASGAQGQSRGLRLPVAPPPPLFEFHGGHHGGHHGFPGFIVVEREVPVIVKLEAPPPPPAVPLPEQAQGGTKARKSYVVGGTYASLPSGCMKMIEGGDSYYFCGGGEWYKLVGKEYRAVARKL